MFSWRTESCVCCGCVGLWHDDLGQNRKITLPGITTLLRCLLLLLDLEEDMCFFFNTCVTLFFNALLNICKSGIIQAASLRISLKEEVF